MAKRALTHLLVEVLAGGSLNRMSRPTARRSKTWGGHEARPYTPFESVTGPAERAFTLNQYTLPPRPITLPIGASPMVSRKAKEAA